MRSRRMITVVGCHAGGEVGNVVVGGVLPPRRRDGVRADAGAAARGRLAAAAAAARAARQRRLSRQPRRPGDAARLRRGLHHHGADRVSGHVRLEHDLHDDRSARDRDDRAARAGDGRPARGAGRRRRGACVLPRRPLRERRAHERPLLRRPARRPARGRGDRHRRPSTSPTAACGTRSPTRRRSASRSSRHEARDLSLAGERIRAAAREQLPCVHPENPAIAGVSIVQLAAPWQGVGAVTRNAVVVAPGPARPLGDRDRAVGADGRPARARPDGRSATG